MAINEWKIWKKLGIVKEKKEYIDIDKDINAIIEFLNEVGPSLEVLASLYKQFKALRKMELKLIKEKVRKSSLKENILKQIRKYDKILKAYELLELDVDITGERVKKIAKGLEKKAEELQIDKALLEKITKSMQWTFDW